jgi:fructoselysine-6-P-deglycase FrlB-like protein
MASLDDILTTQKNGVVGVNGISQAFLRGQGTVTSSTATASSVIFNGRGYLVNVCVVVAGSSAGAIHNANTAANASASNQLFSIPTTVGVYQLGQVFTTGLVLVPGTGQSINVTYTPG